MGFLNRCQLIFQPMRKFFNRQLPERFFIGEASSVDLYADRGGPLIPIVVNKAQESGVGILDVHISAPSLENLFLHHTGRSLRE